VGSAIIVSLIRTWRLDVSAGTTRVRNYTRRLCTDVLGDVCRRLLSVTADALAAGPGSHLRTLNRRH